MSIENNALAIKIKCKHCKNEQEYNLRNPEKIPKRPKTQCSNPECDKWIYIDRDLLVKKLTKDQNTLTKKDQVIEQKKSLKSSAKAQKPKKPENQLDLKMTKTSDQRPKTIDQKDSHQITQKSMSLREKEVINYINGMFKEVQSYGRVIPIDTKQTIVNGVFDNILNLMKGIKYYLNAWERRYQRYLREKPENPLIDDYKDMQKTLDFLLKLKKLKELIKNPKKESD